MSGSHVVICGWGPNVRRLVTDLLRSDPTTTITVVSADVPTPPPFVTPPQVRLVDHDPSTPAGLEAAGVKNADVVVILADSRQGRTAQDTDARTILTTLAVEKAYPSVHTVAELLNEENIFHARNAGVDEVLISDAYSGAMLSQATQSPNIISVFSDLFRAGVGSRIYEADMPETDGDMRFSAVRARMFAQQRGVLFGFRRDGSLNLVPHANAQLQQADRLLFIQQLPPGS